MNTLFEIPDSLARHPAKYSKQLFPDMIRMLAGATTILDPFGGVGGIFVICPWFPNARIEAVEIESEWANQHIGVTLGNALALPWADGTFDAICTSPTFANRMADHHEARDDSPRNTYKHAIGHPLHPDNSGAMQWGDKYREFHFKAWKEARRVSVPGAIFVLNIKDHIRAGERQRVTDWHVNTLKFLGYEVIEHCKIVCSGNGFGANGNVRVKYDSLIKFQLGEI